MTKQKTTSEEWGKFKYYQLPNKKYNCVSGFDDEFEYDAKEINLENIIKEKQKEAIDEFRNREERKQAFEKLK